MSINCLTLPPQMNGDGIYKFHDFSGETAAAYINKTETDETIYGVSISLLNGSNSEWELKFSGAQLGETHWVSMGGPAFRFADATGFYIKALFDGNVEVHPSKHGALGAATYVNTRALEHGASTTPPVSPITNLIEQAKNFHNVRNIMHCEDAVVLITSASDDHLSREYDIYAATIGHREFVKCNYRFINEPRHADRDRGIARAHEVDLNGKTVRCNLLFGPESGISHGLSWDGKDLKIDK